MERVVGTRGSPLALWQAHHVKGRLEEHHAGLDVRIEIIKTEGDVRVDVPFGDLPGKGFFVKEIEAALLSGAIDLAVHSLKDMPSELPDNLMLSAVLERHDPQDAVLSVAGLLRATAVAPFMPGGVSTTFRSTVVGRSIPIAFSS